MYSFKFEQKFILPVESLPKVFDFADPKIVKLIPRTYTVELFEQFSRFQLGKYSLRKAELRWSNVSIEFQCNDKRCAKKFKIYCSKDEVSVDKELLFSVVSEGKECNHEKTTPRNSCFAGPKREILKSELKVKPINTVYREMIAKDDIVKVSKGVTGKSLLNKCYK